ncbi:uncharacterized protein MKZ38_000037 [Zalerion maritima]|uniref:CENP-V/GFA domain-containing protein n=1 Tax=Zalerion maritima TaxID=339359 RepID=A0AAD5RRY6_9PEZI|nr:uncharacterized protein MKZ38_000037 [Zalerion maritima]
MATQQSKMYGAGCHCGYITFKITLTPPLEQQQPNDCGCSICRRNGYLLVYPLKTDVQFHGESRQRCAEYRFNAKNRAHLFCPKCGSALGIDFEKIAPKYGINVRSLNGVDMGSLNIRKDDGVQTMEPEGVDLSGTTYTEE